VCAGRQCKYSEHDTNTHPHTHTHATCHLQQVEFHSFFLSHASLCFFLLSAIKGRLATSPKGIQSGGLTWCRWQKRFFSLVSLSHAHTPRACTEVCLLWSEVRCVCVCVWSGALPSCVCASGEEGRLWQKETDRVRWTQRGHWRHETCLTVTACLPLPTLMSIAVSARRAVRTAGVMTRNRLSYSNQRIASYLASSFTNSRTTKWLLHHIYRTFNPVVLAGHFWLRKRTCFCFFYFVGRVCHLVTFVELAM